VRGALARRLLLRAVCVNSKPLPKEDTNGGHEGENKQDIDVAADKAKSATDKAVDKAKAAARRAGETVKKAGERIKEQGR
jgi:hypothetical protein